MSRSPVPLPPRVRQPRGSDAPAVLRTTKRRRRPQPYPPSSRSQSLRPSPSRRACRRRSRWRPHPSRQPASDPPPAPVEARRLVDDDDDSIPEGWSVVDFSEGVPTELDSIAPAQRRQDDGVLRGISAIRRFFRTSETPVWFVSATAFNLLGIDRWVRSLGFVNYYDSFDGTPPGRVRARRTARRRRSTPSRRSATTSSATRRWSTTSSPGRRQGPLPHVRRGDRALAREAGLEVAFPPAALRHRLDSKIVTTQLGDEAGVPSVPNSWDGRRVRELRALADGAALGTALVVQTPYGDSGQTTFFVSTESDWHEHAGSSSARSSR